ncbi:MAG: Gfo/Idh/MocA family oxidoreductase [Armatimonadetes bacterium]|nr:Gfo/Idh/MocA family oxidoreductase [Armatimonadota bacterium]
MNYGIGVIGVGVRGQHSYELALKAHPSCRLRAVSQYPGVSEAMLEGKDPKVCATQYAQEHDAVYYADYRDLLARDDVHIISLMCEPSAAPELVEACCAAGKHIVRDKPICADMDGARRIVNAIDRAGVQMLVTLGTRFSPTLRTMREQVIGGAVGDILVASFTFIQGGGPLAGFIASPGYLESVGGGEVTNFGYYALDYLLWLTGSEVESVYALMGSEFYPDYQYAGMEDMGTLSLRFESGAVGHMTTGRTTTQNPPESYFRADVTGTAGTITCHSAAEQVTMHNGGARNLSFAPEAIPAMIGAFIEALDGGSESPITARDGARVLRVLKAAYLSAQEGREVRLEEIAGV